MLVKFLTSLSIGFLSGVFIHSLFFVEPISSSWIVVLIIIGILLILFFKNIRVMLIAVFCIGVVFGLLRFSSSIETTQSDIFDVFASESESMTIYGTIISEPITYVSYTEFTVQAQQLITHAEATLSVDTNILVKTDTYTDYEYGQNVVIQGVLRKPEAFITDSNRSFDYEAYLAKDNIYYIMSYAGTQVFDNGEGSIQRSLYQLKHRFLQQIYRIIPEPESGLLSGILFGQKSALDDDLEEKFRIVGLMHIIVLSGYNVSLVIQIFTKLLRFLPLGIRSLLAVLSIMGFALLVGAGPTVVRASIMAVFIVLADILGGRYNISRALFIAGLIMIIINPKILFFDISFQLSFLATYGLIVFSPYLEKKLSFLPEVFAIRSSATATLAAQIMVVPLIIYAIGEFSIISPIVNVLVLFAVPYSMLFGFLTSLFGMIIPVLALPLGLVTTYLLKYQLLIVDVFSALPFSHITLPPFRWFWMILLYVLIFMWIRNIQKNITEKI